MFYLGIDQHAKQLTVDRRDTEGNAIVILRTDPAMRAWSKKIKCKKGGGVARIAVMRRMATILWHMLTKRKTSAEVRNLGIGLAA